MVFRRSRSASCLRFQITIYWHPWHPLLVHGNQIDLSKQVSWIVVPRLLVKHGVIFREYISLYVNRASQSLSTLRKKTPTETDKFVRNVVYIPIAIRLWHLCRDGTSYLNYTFMHRGIKIWPYEKNMLLKFTAYFYEFKGLNNHSWSTR